MNKKNRTGERFGRLVIVEEKETKKYKPRTYERMFLCQCDCGNTVVSSYSNLKAGHVRSCGCLKKDCNTGKFGNESKDSELRLRMIWQSMKNRCNAKKGKNFRIYGEQGIKVCELWANNFESFYEWAINNGYHTTLSIDRIDGTKDYSPDNCRWVTAKVQANNLKTNVIFMLNGVSHTIPEWSQILNIPSYILHQRRRSGWDDSKILTTAVRKYKK